MIIILQYIKILNHYVVHIKLMFRQLYLNFFKWCQRKSLSLDNAKNKTKQNNITLKIDTLYLSIHGQINHSGCT